MRCSANPRAPACRQLLYPSFASVMSAAAPATRSTRCRARWLSRRAYASWGGASGFVPAERIRANFDSFAADRFIIGRRARWWSRSAAMANSPHRPYAAAALQWPGLDQKTVVRTLERLGPRGGELSKRRLVRRRRVRSVRASVDFFVGPRAKPRTTLAPSLTYVVA